MTQQKNYQEEFKKLYTGFEDWSRIHFPNMKDMKYLEGNFSLEPYKKKLEFFRYLRNLITHYNEIQGFDMEQMVTINEELLKSFQSMVDEIQLPALRHAIPRESIIYRSFEDSVVDAIHEMVRLNITHMPIIEGDRVVGLFGENSLFRIKSEGKFSIDEHTTFAEIGDYIALKGCELVKSVSEEATIPECIQEFSNAISKGRRLDLLLITKGGSFRDELLGLITTWDVIGMR